MKALVLIGGFGTRLRPLTYQVPKQLIPIAGKPMLYHVFDLVPPEVDEAVLATGYKADVIDAYVRSHPPRFRVTMVPEREPLGTGGGMRNAGDGMSDPFLLLNSDVVAAIDVPALLVRHAQCGGVGTMTLAHVDDTSPYGVAALGADDRIERFVEKPKPENAPSHWINAGLAVWRASVLERIPRGRPVSFETEIVPGLLPEGIYGFRVDGFWEDAGTPARLLHAQRLLFAAGRGAVGTLPDGASGQGPVAADRSVRARGATVGPNVTLGADVEVAAGAHVEDAVVMDGARIGAGAVVVRSIVGPHSLIEAGRRVDGEVVATVSGP